MAREHRRLGENIKNGCGLVRASHSPKLGAGGAQKDTGEFSIKWALCQCNLALFAMLNNGWAKAAVYHSGTNQS